MAVKSESKGYGCVGQHSALVMGLYTMCLKPDIDKIEMEQWDEIRKDAPPVFHPEATFRKYWDIGSVVLILYSCCSVPYFLAMGDEPQGSVVIWDKTVDVLFMVDICLNFFTARFMETDDGPELVTSYGGIASLYFRGWFVPDFLSSFPFDLLVQAIYSADEINPEAVRMAKLGRILRMLKILRMVRIKKLLSKLQYAMGLKNGTVDIVQFFMFIAFAAHFNACGFYVRGQSSDPSSWTRSSCFSTPVDEATWDEHYSYDTNYISMADYDSHVSVSSDTTAQQFYEMMHSGSVGSIIPPLMHLKNEVRRVKEVSAPFDPDPNLCECNQTENIPPYATERPFSNLEDQCIDKPNAYWVTFYWSIVTMTTVGYGDYYPLTTDERFYCLWAMGVSAVVFAFAMTSICTFIINLNTNEVYKQNRFDELIGYMNLCKVDSIFQRRCIDYFGYKTGDKSMAAYYNLDHITSEEFKTVVAKDIFESTYKDFLQNHCPLANACTSALFRDLARHLHLSVYGPKDTVCSANVPGSADMFILHIGKIGVVHPVTKEHQLGHLVYGTQALFGLTMYPSSVEALDFCDIYSLSSVIFKECLEKSGMNILQFEVDMKARGKWDKNPEYLTLYDDWEPLEETCSPQLGDHVTEQFQDLSTTDICSQAFDNEDDERIALEEFDQRQRAYISVLLLNKRKNGKAEAPTINEAPSKADNR